MRRATRVLVPVLLLLGLGLLPAQAEPSETFQLEARVPASTLAFLSVEDLTSWESRVQETAIGKIFNDPEMQAFLEPIAEGVMELAKGSMGEVPPVVFEVMAQLEHLKGQLGVALVDLDPEDEKIQLAASFDFGSHVGEFVTFLDKVREELDPSGDNVRRMERNGRTWWHMQADKVPVYATIVDSAFVAATDDALLDDILAGAPAAPLSADADFQLVRERVGGDDLGLFFYGNVDVAMEKFGGMMPEEPRAMANVFGLDTVASVAYGMSFKGNGFRDTLMVHAPEADHGIIPLYQIPPMTAPRTLDLVPSGALYWSEGNLPLSDLIGRMRGLMGQIDPDATEQLDGMLAQAKQMIGVDVEEDLLAGLSGNYGGYVALPDTGGLYPEVAVILGLKDPAAYEGVFTRMSEAIAGSLNEQGRIIASTRVIEYHGVRMHLFEMQKASGNDPVPFTPTWAVLGDRLIITLVPYAMKEIILRVQGITTTPGLATQEDFQALMRMKPAGAGVIEYIDLKAILSLLYDTGVPLLQTLVKPNVLKDVPFPIDWAQLPPASRVVPHLGSLAEFVTVNENGLVIDVQGPMPLFPLMFTGMSLLPIALMSARSGGVPTPVEFGPGGPSVEAEMNAELAQIHAEMLAEAVAFFRSEKDRLPTTLIELEEAGLLESVPNDPWGGAYRLRTEGEDVVVESAGPDQVFGNADDVKHTP